MSAPRPAQPRRKQHAAPRPTNQRRAPRPAQAGAARPAPRQGQRSGPRETRAGRPQTRAGLLTRLRARWAGLRRARADRKAQRQVGAVVSEAGKPPSQWPRRVALGMLKLGSAVGVAWALLVCGHEVYDYATTSPRFEVQHLIYEPTAHVDDDALRELLAIEPGTNILACDLAALSERIAAHPWVAEAIVTRNLPDTLQIQVVEHEPEAIVLAERFYLVDRAGQPFKPVERGERGELPIITGIDRALLAEDRAAAVAEISEALEVVRLYQSKQRPRLGEVNLGEDRSVTLYTAETGTQLRLGRSDFEARLARWDALRAALGDRADRLAVVHLDHESKPDRRDRVVARFADDRDQAMLLAQAAEDATGSEPDSSSMGEDAEATTPAQPPAARTAGRRNRIPRYE